MTKPKGVKKQNYSPNKLNIALKAMKDGRNPSAVSAMYKIPRSTLISKATGKRPTTCGRPGPKPLLGKYRLY